MEIEQPRRECQKERQQRFIEQVRTHRKHAQYSAFITRHQALNENEKADRLRHQVLRTLRFGKTQQVWAKDEGEAANVVESAVEVRWDKLHPAILEVAASACHWGKHLPVRHSILTGLTGVGSPNRNLFRTSTTSRGLLCRTRCGASRQTHCASGLTAAIDSHPRWPINLSRPPRRQSIGTPHARSASRASVS